MGLVILPSRELYPSLLACQSVLATLPSCELSQSTGSPTTRQAVLPPPRELHHSPVAHQQSPGPTPLPLAVSVPFKAYYTNNIPYACFRLFGFLFGSVLAGGAAYSYLLQEYKASNDLLTEDVYVRLSCPLLYTTTTAPTPLPCLGIEERRGTEKTDSEWANECRPCKLPSPA